jgi:triacylglycerol esterase/lipase EstA (alpha/beta hydrolase family)
MMFRRATIGLAACVAAITLTLGVTEAVAPPASAQAPYPVGNAATGYQAELDAPNSSPPGVNVAGCQPSAAHPYPVILLPGTLYTVAETWQALGPILANAGYCVYGLNYGQTTLTTLTGGRVSSIGPIEDSALQLAAFVDQVRGETGAAQVDLVGWSQGGMLPRWYMTRDGGAPAVHELVGLAPSNHGTTLDGLFALINSDTALGLPATTTLIGCTACTEQEAGSPFINALNANGDGVPGVKLVSIETTHDEVVTPYQSAFLDAPGAVNITLQDQCPADGADHLGIPYDTAALQDVVNVLGPDTPGFEPVCGLTLPLIGTP